MNNRASTTQILTADGAVGPSGARIRVYNVTWLSDGTARAVVLRNGTADSADILVSQLGTISLTNTIDFGPEGIVFPSGCFFDVGSVARAAITYSVDVA